MSAWFVDNADGTGGNENADKCAWSWGDIQAPVGDAFANLYQGGHFYLVQQNWVDDGAGYCGMRIQTP